MINASIAIATCPHTSGRPLSRRATRFAHPSVTVPAVQREVSTIPSRQNWSADERPTTPIAIVVSEMMRMRLVASGESPPRGSANSASSPARSSLAAIASKTVTRIAPSTGRDRASTRWP